MANNARYYGWIIFTVFALQSSVAAADSLTLLARHNYIDPEALVSYREKFGVEVLIQNFGTNEELDQLITAGTRDIADIIVVPGSKLEGYVRKGLVKALPSGLKGELPQIDSRWWHAYPSAEWYGVPLYWGTLGVAYRRDLVDSPMEGWMDFFIPQDSLKGKIAVLPSAREATGMALKSIGHSLNVRSERASSAALDLLRSQSPHVKEYTKLISEPESPLVSGVVVAAMMFNGDAVALQKYNENIAYLLPKEGGGVWVDYLVVSSRSKDSEAALNVIRYLSEAGVAAELATYSSQATPNSESKNFLGRHLLENSAIYPDPEALDRSELFENKLPRYTKGVLDSYRQIMQPIETAQSLAFQ